MLDVSSQVSDGNKNATELYQHTVNLSPTNAKLLIKQTRQY